MREENKHVEQVEKYLDGEMEWEELCAFEKELKVNPDLRQELEFYQMAHSVVIQHKLASVRETIGEVKDDYVKNRKNKVFRKGLLVFVAALLTSLAGMYFFMKSEFLINSENKSSTKGKESIESKVSDIIEEQRKGQEVLMKVEEEVVAEDIENKKDQPEKQPVNKTGVSTTIAPEAGTAVNDSAAAVQNKSVLNADSLDKNINPDTNNVSVVVPDQYVPALLDTVPVVNCRDVHITAGTEVYPTCIYDKDGKIFVSGVKGGAKPYMFKLTTGEENADGKFTGLKPGVYQVFITDANQCEEVLSNIVVKETHCKLDLFLDPSGGVPLVFPEYEKAGVLSIFDKRGAAMFSATIKANEQFEWSGVAGNNTLTPGYYLFIIKYEDGKVQKGSITITP